MFLFIFSVVNSLVVGYDVEINENPCEGNSLTECLTEHEKSTHHICENNYGRIAAMENYAKDRLFKQENNIDCALVDLFELYESFNHYPYFMKTTDDHSDGEHDGYTTAPYDSVENSTICGYIVNNITKNLSVMLALLFFGMIINI